MGSENLSYVETIQGDFINIGKIEEITWIRNGNNEMDCIIILTDTGKRHEIIVLPLRNAILSHPYGKGKISFDDTHAHILTRLCVEHITNSCKSILSNDDLADYIWLGMWTSDNLELENAQSCIPCID